MTDALRFDYFEWISIRAIGKPRHCLLDSLGLTYKPFVRYREFSEHESGQSDQIDIWMPNLLG